MKHRQIVNIINFIRGCEPRCPIDLIQPVKEQIRLLQENHLKGTFLLQYDALINPEFSDLLKDLPADKIEIGVWLEMVRPLTDKAGIDWRGNPDWTWDSRADCGFSVGYTLEQRKRIIDILFHDFHEIFGYYPKVLGSWAFDAVTLSYANDAYGLDAACFCKEQWGTDGYTLWGGYYGQGWYPSVNNVYIPAQHAETSIPVPIFRMLGADPVYQYDFGLDIGTGADQIQKVCTLEPVYTEAGGGGGIPEWVDWFLQENFNGDCLSFGYAQAGQENSFGWDAMKQGLIYQFELFSKLQAEGKLAVETLGESGRWFQSVYKETPASAIVAREDWKGEEKKSVWYCCKNYRINFYCDKNTFRIRDIYLYRDDYPERYREQPCKTPYLCFDALPLVDGNRFSGNGILAGLFPETAEGTPLTFQDMKWAESSDGTTGILMFTKTECGDVQFTLTESSVKVSAKKPLLLKFRYNSAAAGLPKPVALTQSSLSLEYENYPYTVTLHNAQFDKEGNIAGSGEFSIQMR